MYKYRMSYYENGHPKHRNIKSDKPTAKAVKAEYLKKGYSVAYVERCANVN